MAKRDIHEATTHSSKLIDRVASNEELVITEPPVARLALRAPNDEPRPLGLDAGKLHIADDFDAPLSPEELDAFDQ